MHQFRFKGALVLGMVTFVMAVAMVIVPAAARPGDRHATIVVDGNNGSVLHADKADEPRYPASLTKMMTLYLAFEAIERRRMSYATRLKVSHEAASAPPTKLNLEPGETIAAIDAIRALITKSANDAAVVIAEHLGGSEANFARIMTHKARLFGMSRTTFRNASGLPDPVQITTARDMIALALRLHDDFPQHFKLFSTRAFTYDGTTYRNHNNLLYRFQGTDGIKTGYTRASGFNLVTSVKRGGRHVVGAVFGGATAARRDDTMQLLLARALMRSSPYRTRRPAPVLVAAAEPARRAPAPAAQAQALPHPSPRAQVVPMPQPRPVMVPRARSESAISDASQRWTDIKPPAPVPAMRPVEAGPAPLPVVREPSTRGVPPQAPVRLAAAAGTARAPSSLQHQAAALGRPNGSAPQVRPMPVPYAVRGPDQAHAPTQARAGFEIQIGAFATSAEATRALASARQVAGDVLQAREGRAIPVVKDRRHLHRARFTGFDSVAAAQACLELRRRQIDCFVMRAE